MALSITTELSKEYPNNGVEIFYTVTVDGDNAETVVQLLSVALKNLVSIELVEREDN